MNRQANYREILSTDDKRLIFTYSEVPDVQPHVEVALINMDDGTSVEMEVEPDVLRSALESLFGGIYSGQA